MQKRGLVVALVLSVLIISLTFASAFSLSDFFKEFYGKITGNVVNDGCSQGLTAYYKLDENVNDASGIAMNGQAIGGVSSVSGKIGNAYQFDGSSGYLNLGRQTSVETSAGSYTLSLWVKADLIENNRLLFNYDRDNVLGNDNSNYDIFSRINNGALTYQVITGCEYNTNIVDLANGNWHHLIFISESSSSGTRAKVYEDGVQKLDNNACTRKWNSAMSDYILRLGFNGNINFWKGAVDEVSVWNRALSASEITDLYNSGSGKDVCPSLPVVCTENWTCSSWNECSNSQQTRTCNDGNNCGTTSNKPAINQSCVINIVTPTTTNITTNAPTINTSTNVVTQDNQTNVSVQIVCPSIISPSCVGGTLVQRGLDANGCQLPPTCVISNISSNAGNGVTTTNINTSANCNGCLYNNDCLPVGYRFDNNGTNSYCDISGIFAQKVNTENLTQSCQNDFECTTNLCSEGQCVSLAGFRASILKLICRITSIFSGTYDDCVNQYVLGVNVTTNTTINDTNITVSSMNVSISGDQVTSVSGAPLEVGMVVIVTMENGTIFSATVTSVSTNGVGTLDIAAPAGVTAGEVGKKEIVSAWQCWSPVAGYPSPARNPNPECSDDEKTGFINMCLNFETMQRQRIECGEGKKCEVVSNNIKCTNLCGNVKIDSGEVCDGELLALQTCRSQMGSNYGGKLGCDSDCKGFDESGCHECLLGTCESNGESKDCTTSEGLAGKKKCNYGCWGGCVASDQPESPPESPTDNPIQTTCNDPVYNADPANFCFCNPSHPSCNTNPPQTCDNGAVDYPTCTS